MYSCNEAFKLTIPAIRIALAKAMAAQKISQSDIAKKLGVAQPAVSKYLSGKYSKEVRAIENAIDRRSLDNLTKAAVAGDKKEITGKIDRLASDKRLVDRAMGFISVDHAQK